MGDSVKQILIRVTKEEKEEIEELAKSNKQTVTAFIKRKVLSNEIAESYQNDILEREEFLKQQIEELKKEREEDRRHYIEWVGGLNQSLKLMNEEKEKLLERNSSLLIELDEQKNKSFFQRLKDLF
ncbi:plasmid mobilization protein [Streptococcus suis]|uniref:plasmid mobilization protein n=1 Tax=Streptococcus suis TaxID=1307 RepID=UPI000CF6D360